MRCTNCGDPVRDPVWATYADKGFTERPEEQGRKTLEVFPLHKKCFERDETVPVSEWVDDPDHEDYSEENRVMKLEHSRARRYQKAQAP